MLQVTPPVGDELFDGVVYPVDCAFLIALPLTLDEFRADVAAALARDPAHARGDFAATHALDKGARSADEGWHLYGASLVERITELIQSARSVGVGQVVPRAD